MDRRREQSHREDDQAAPARPAPAPAVTPGIGSAQAVLAMQRGAGNAAVAAAVGSRTVARDKTEEKKKSGGITGFFKNLFGGKKKPEMKPQEKKAVEGAGDAAKKGTAIAGGGEKNQEKPGDGDAGTKPAAGGADLKSVVDDAKKLLTTITDANAAKKEPGGAAPAAEEKAPEPQQDDPLDAVGGLFGDLEKMVEEALERDRLADELLYTNAKELAAVIAANGTGGGGVFSTMLVAVFEHVAKAWLTNSRRQLNLPEDKPRRQELEALIEEHKWITDAKAAEASAQNVEPDPKMRAKDLNRYKVKKGTLLWFVKDDGTWGKSPFNQDFAFSELPKGTLNGVTGYIWEVNGKKYLFETKNVEHETGGGFEAAPGPLFPPDPEAAHVKQTSLGDCYLQAAVASLADNNPGLIKAMFRDNDKDGTVTVRLYKPDRSDPAKPTFSAQYVTVKKTLPKDITGAAAYNAGANWVRLLEKAYAAGGFTGVYGKAAPAVRDYESIAGGFSQHAMEVLTGQPVTKESKWNVGWHGVGDGLPWGAGEEKRYAEAKLPGGKYEGTASFGVFGNEADVDKWMVFTKTKDFTDIYGKHQAKLQAGYASDLTIDDFKAGLDKWSEAGLAAKMLAHVEKQQLLPGKLGTAKYSKTQLELFRKIEAHLLKGGTVTVSSWKYPGEKKSADPNVTTSAGEAVHKGMVGGHAFSVLGARSVATQDPEDKSIGDFYWVKIRNPWGRYGRKYDFTKSAEEQGIAEPQGDGVSWVELSDMTRYFHSFDYG